MTPQNPTAQPHLELVPATLEQAPVLANLLELYIYDFSEFLDLEIGEDGRFAYPFLPLYWSEPHRHPFLIRMDGRWAGLVLVKAEAETPDVDAVWDMAEFFVIRGCRRRGVGTQAAHEVWRRFPGRWQVRVMQSNAAAQRFWATAIATFAGELADPLLFEKGGKLWSLFSFESKDSLSR